MVTWLACYFATFRGVNSITVATRYTVVAPWVLLAIFIIFNATLDGASDGVHAYIGEWDLNVLNSGDAWSDAAGQVLFSVGATVGTNDPLPYTRTLSASVQMCGICAASTIPVDHREVELPRLARWSCMRTMNAPPTPAPMRRSSGAFPLRRYQAALWPCVRACVYLERVLIIRGQVTIHGAQDSIPCMHCAGVMSAYASFAPATTNIWADNNYICFINCFTSFFAGFAVFSILGSMAHRQSVIAGDSSDLRIALCTQNSLDLACPAECSRCGQDDWMSLPQSSCCGNFQTRNVAEDSFILVFSVRARFSLKKARKNAHAMFTNRSIL